jgi:CheY-like chemotaxis protein
VRTETKALRSDDPVNILMVDDHPGNLLALRATLEPLGENLVSARSGREALGEIEKQDFALVLLDVRMVGLDGFETAQLIRQHERARDTPIIFLSAIHT